jgi:hypothetical protein
MSLEATVEAVSCEMVAIWQRHEHESRRISIFGNPYLAMPSVGIEDSAGAVVICQMHELVRVL